MTERPASIRRQRERVPASLEDAVFTAIEKLPADRFASAAEFAAALTESSSGRAADSPSRRAAGSPSRRAVLLVAAGAATLALGALGGFALRPAPERHAAPARFEIAADGRMVMVRRTQLPELVLIQNVDQLVHAGTGQ